MQDKASEVSSVSGMASIRGLTGEEVEERKRRGEVNNLTSSTSRPISHILRSNLFTLFNAILAVAVVLLLAVGQYRDAVLTSGLVVFSVAISTFQEIRAKLRLDHIALLARSPVRVIRDGQQQSIDPAELVLGEYLVLTRGESVVADGVLVLAEQLEVDESLLSGESEPVAKSAGDKVLSGSFCVAGTGVYIAQRIGEASYAQKLASAAKVYRHQRTPTQLLLDKVLKALLVVVGALALVEVVVFINMGVDLVEAIRATAVIATLVPQGLLLMSTVAYSVGAVRLAQTGALVQELNAVESLSHVDALCLDKTGTLTGNRLELSEVIPLNGAREDAEKSLATYAASFPDPNATLAAIAALLPAQAAPIVRAVPFSSQRKWSALAFASSSNFGILVLGAPEALLSQVADKARVQEISASHTAAGRRVLLLTMAEELAEAKDSGEAIKSSPCLPRELKPVALVTLDEELRPDAKATLDSFAARGVAVKVISGDNPETVLSVAKKAGLPATAEAISGRELSALSGRERTAALREKSVFGRISPENKEGIIADLRDSGSYVAMIGDGVNDVLALKQANVGVAMRSGSPATRAVADVILLNDSFNVLPKALGEGRRVINSMLLLIKLFLIRDAATIGLILATAIVGAPFPLLPPHAAVIGFLTVGLPSLFVVAWASEAIPKRESLRDIAIPVLQLGIISALAIMSVYFLALYFQMDIAQARTAAVTASLISGLLALNWFWYPLNAPLAKFLANRRVLLLSLVSMLIYIVLLYSGWPASYLELSVFPPLSWLMIVPTVFVWFAILRLLACRGVCDGWFD